MFKGKEELEEMYKSEVLDFMKDIVFPNRTKGGLIMTNGFTKEIIGTDMSTHRPIIDGVEYTWNYLETYPNPLLRVLAYRLWSSYNGGEEEWMKKK